ncbi:MAG: hypothetical protein IBX72_11935 [Nitrospirae bacterium]|jgi:hypothetical protein|nr:hypothetical protein [Nitrospirota bacterium]
MKKLICLLAISALIIPFAAYGIEADPGKSIDRPATPSFKKLNIKTDVPEVKPNIPDEYKPVIETYDKYWNFIKENDLDSAYLLETDDYKEVVSLREYKGLQKRGKVPVNIKAVRALEVTQKGEKEVIVKGTMWLKAAQIETLKVFYDRWVKSGEGWRHLREIEEHETSEKGNS